MRFIFNFIFFGILFYAIWFFFPDAFTKLVQGAHAVFDFIKDFVVAIIDKINQTKSTPAPAPAPAHSALIYLMFLNYFSKN